MLGKLGHQATGLVHACDRASAGDVILRLRADLRAVGERIGRVQSRAEIACLPHRIDGEISGVVAERAVRDQARRRCILKVVAIPHEQRRGVTIG